MRPSSHRLAPTRPAFHPTRRVRWTGWRGWRGACSAWTWSSSRVPTPMGRGGRQPAPRRTSREVPGPWTI
ncbi:hypothetical protein DBL07_00030, partial [Achromobacter mucicolens]